MLFSLPIRLAAPLLALVFGLAVTLFDYRLHLDLDLARNQEELREQTHTNGRRLAHLSGKFLADGDLAALQAELEAMAEFPGIEIAGVVDERGRVLADSTGTLRGSVATRGPLAEAAALIAPVGPAREQYGEDAEAVVSAHPFRLGDERTGWALLEADRTQAISAARADAAMQLRWMASAMAFLSLTLWALLHFGVAARLGRLAQAVRAFGEGTGGAPVALRGRDEVAALSRAFAAMAADLHQREEEKVRLEREVLEVSEKEQRRIGHDLHDGLGQRLTAASMAINAAVAGLQTAAPAQASRVEDIGRQIREAIAETRALAHGLAPVDLKDEGLAQALRGLAAGTAQSTGIRCIFECPAPIDIADPTAAIHLYRIAQEAVHNALKHASPGEIRIGLERRNGSVVMEVDDDGAGLPEISATAGGIGLRVMRHRAELAGGTLAAGPAPAGGTRIACHLPLLP